MEYGYSILMGIFAAAILVYAGLMAIFRDYKMLPLRARQSVKPKDPKRYMLRLSAVVALVAAAPALSALAGLFSIIAALIVLVLGLVGTLWLGTIIMKGVR